MSRLFLEAAMRIQSQALERIKHLERAMPSLHRLEALEGFIRSNALPCQAEAGESSMAIKIHRADLDTASALIEMTGHKVLSSDGLLILPPDGLDDLHPHTFSLVVMED